MFDIITYCTNALVAYGRMKQHKGEILHAAHFFTLMLSKVNERLTPPTVILRMISQNIRILKCSTT